MQLGEVKRGLKAYKASGATNEDFQRHVMFVQVWLPVCLPPWRHTFPARCLLLSNVCKAESPL